jgi:hypothetical protein
MAFSRSKLFATAVLTTVTLAMPSFAGPYNNGDEDDYGSGPGRMMMKDRMMDERMGEGMMGARDCPGWMRHGRFHRPWMDRRGPGMMGGGYGEHGWMMRRGGGGMGPGMMYGYDAEDQREMNLTTDQVKRYLNQMIRNPNLTVGQVQEKDADTIVAEIVTKQGNALVQRLDFNRHTGFVRPEQQSKTTTGKSPEDREERDEQEEQK